MSSNNLLLMNYSVLREELFYIRIVDLLKFQK